MSLSFIHPLCYLHMLLGLFYAIGMLFFYVVPACHALLLHYLFLLLRLFPLCISSLPLLARRCTLTILPVNWASVMLCVVSSIRFGSIVLLRFLRVSHIIIRVSISGTWVACGTFT